MKKENRLKQLQDLKKAKPEHKWIDSEIERIKQEIKYDKEIKNG